VVVHFVRRFAEIILTDTLMVRLPELALDTQHSQINLMAKQFDLSHYQWKVLEALIPQGTG
jgi:hypothetical protein